MNVFKKTNPYLILFLLVIIGFWQVAFFAYALKWDVIDVVFPFRYFFSECIQSGNFPFWNPYQHTGTPFFSDLQAPTYYPELLFISLIGGYNVYIMHILFALYLYIAAIGMYKLSYYFNKSLFASLVAGLAYSLSGYVVGHGQHFFLLVGTAWIPYIILFYIKLNQERKPIDALKAGIYIFLMITGSYQALSIALFYLIALIFLYFIILASVKKHIKLILEIVKVNVLLLIVVLLFSIPLIVSTLEIMNSVERLGEGVSLTKTLGFGQSSKSILSFLVPFSTLKNPEFFGGADASMTNHFFGIIPLVFFVAALFRKRSVLEYIILGFGLIIMAMSFKSLPIREFMYLHIPFMNLFLSAAYIRVFGLFAFILISANYIAHFVKNMRKEKNKIVAIALAFLSILLFLIIYSIEKNTINDFIQLLHFNSYQVLVKNLTFHQHVLLQAVFQFAIVSLFILIIIYYKRLKSPVYWIVILFSLEIVVATQLNMNATVVDTSSKPYRMQKDLSLCPDKFPIPINDKIILNDQQHAFFKPFWRNTYIFTKQVSSQSFSSFELSSFSKLDDDYPKLKDAVLNNHLFYFSDKILPLKHFSDSSINIQNNNKYLYLSDEDFSALSDKTVAIDNLDKISILEFLPNAVKIETNTQNDQFLTMLQTNFKGWKAFIDNKYTPIYTSNFNYRTIFLPKGNHIVRYEYKNRRLLILYIISNAFFIFCVLFLLGYWLHKKSFKRRYVFFIPLVVLFMFILLSIKCMTYKNSNLGTHQVYSNRWSTKNAIISYKKNFENELIGCDSVKGFTDKNCFNVDSNIEFLPIANFVNEDQKLNSSTMVVTTNIFPKSYSQALIVSELIRTNQPSEWHATKLEKQIENLNQWNDIIYQRNFYNLNEKDSIKVYLWNPKKSEFRIDNIIVDFYD